MPLFEIRTQSESTAILEELYRAYQSVRTPYVFHIQAEDEDEAIENYREHGEIVYEGDDEYGDVFDSEFQETLEEIDREFESDEVIQVRNIDEEPAREVRSTPYALGGYIRRIQRQNEEHDWEV
jgi:hypothetical protein